jgi:DNA-binding NarL/FixJ family response regulator
MTLRCVIVDDSPAVLRAAGDLLNRQGLAIVGAATTADEAIHLVDEHRPDAILVDIDLGADSGFALVRRLASGDSDVGPRCILMSIRDQADYADLIAASPAVGFLSKSDLSAAAIRRLLHDGGETSDY